MLLIQTQHFILFSHVLIETYLLVFCLFLTLFRRLKFLPHFMDKEVVFVGKLKVLRISLSIEDFLVVGKLVLNYVENWIVESVLPAYIFLI